MVHVPINTHGVHVMDHVHGTVQLLVGRYTVPGCRGAFSLSELQLRFEFLSFLTENSKVYRADFRFPPLFSVNALARGRCSRAGVHENHLHCHSSDARAPIFKRTAVPWSSRRFSEL